MLRVVLSFILFYLDFFLTFSEATGQLYVSLRVSDIDAGSCALLPGEDKRVEDIYWLQGSVTWQQGVHACLFTCTLDIYIFSIAWLYKATFEDIVVFHAPAKVCLALWRQCAESALTPTSGTTRLPLAPSHCPLTF